MKYLRLRVCPPDGVVKISAPHGVSMAQINQFVTEKAAWITEQQVKVRARPKLRVMRYQNGEIHQVFGKDYPLSILPTRGRERVQRRDGLLEIHCHPSATRDRRKALLDSWYRERLQRAIPKFIDKHEARMGVRVKEFRIRKMKTRWGSCNIQKKRIWLSLELASKPLKCLEYVVVHEMVHLLEASHNKRFQNLMSKYLPDWRERKEQLNMRSS